MEAAVVPEDDVLPLHCGCRMGTCCSAETVGELGSSSQEDTKRVS